MKLSEKFCNTVNNIFRGLGEIPSRKPPTDTWREETKALIIAAFDGDEVAKQRLLHWSHGTTRQQKRPRKDLTGKTFGHLTVIGMSDKTDKSRAIYWNCQCDCGNKTVVRGSNLTALSTTSCGHMQGQKKNQDMLR